MNTLLQLEADLNAAPRKPVEGHARFFKTGPGEYAQGDAFLGIATPVLRGIAKKHRGIGLQGVESLLDSPFNERRLLGLFILVDQYDRGTQEEKKACFDFFFKNIEKVNNWNLVDSSAHLIVGDYLLHTGQQHGPLLQLAASEHLWTRRVAIVATWAFTRKGHLEATFAVAQKLLQDPHDLIHKATGWMLREAGKRDEPQLITFLEHYGPQMPKTMLRYARERLK